MASKKILITVDITTKSAEVNVDKVVNKLKELEGAQTKVTKATEKGRAQSGLNNAILLETGRLASDASYGFTAIANNLSQVVTLFASFIETNKSVTKSFKELGKSLIGTGGFLIVVQLLISFGPKLMEMLSGVTQEMKDLKDVQKAAASAAGEQIGQLQTLVRILDDSTQSSFEKQAALDKLRKEHKKLNVELNEEGTLTEESKKAIEEYIPVLKQKALANAIMTKIQAKYVEMLEVEQSSIADNIKFYEAALAFLKSGGRATSEELVKMTLKGKERREQTVVDIQEDINRLIESFAELDTIGTDPEETNAVKTVKAIGSVLKTTNKEAFKDAGAFLKNLSKNSDTQLKIRAKELKDADKMQKKATKDSIKLAEIERDSKLQAYQDVGNGLMALSQLAGKETGVGKTLAIASTLISTYAAAQRAYESQFSLPTLDAPARAAIAAAAAIAQGLANIAAIRKVQTPAGAGGGGGGAVTPTTIEAPDFNVVGAGGVSQLATGLAGITGKPIQAFVVSKEISSAQELDRNITGNASLG
ncbi:hypothetical protein [uncultured Mediterranean phage uvDeep1-CGR2-KM23-C896]|nr:hypothetical protein [uncultured Mediterranean phage uvDeep1-CGR2-KM23-C896]